MAWSFSCQTRLLPRSHQACPVKGLQPTRGHQLVMPIPSESNVILHKIIAEGQCVKRLAIQTVQDAANVGQHGAAALRVKRAGVQGGVNPCTQPLGS